MTKKKVLINNSISGVCQLVITALLTFFSIPVFIHKLGTDLYGVFALVSVKFKFIYQFRIRCIINKIYSRARKKYRIGQGYISIINTFEFNYRSSQYYRVLITFFFPW